MSFTIYFDVETGGVEPRHPTIQLAAIAIDDGTWNEVAHFEQKISFDEAACDPEALKINHYSKEAWTGAIPPGGVAARFAKWCEPYRSVEMTSKTKGTKYNVAKLAGHNALTFDLPRLRQMFGSSFFPFVYHVKDTMQRALWLFDEHPKIRRPESLKLSVLCSYFEIPIDNAHDALSDVRMTLALAKAMCIFERKVHEGREDRS